MTNISEDVKSKCDFSGYASKYNVKCSDGRTIKPGAFSDMTGKKVSLVFQHNHDDPSNIIGNAVLEDRPSGLYCYGTFNGTENGCNAKAQVQHGDINALSIYANHLDSSGPTVSHGLVREVSLVFAGANPGAYIENVAMQHGDGYEEIPDEAIIYSGDDININEVEHSDTSKKSSNDSTDNSTDDSTEDPTIEDVLNSLTPVQMSVVETLIAMASDNQDIQQEDTSDNEIEHEDIDFSEKSDNVLQHFGVLGMHWHSGHERSVMKDVPSVDKKFAKRNGKELTDVTNRLTAHINKNAERIKNEGELNKLSDRDNREIGQAMIKGYTKDDLYKLQSQRSKKFLSKYLDASQEMLDKETKKSPSGMLTKKYKATAIGVPKVAIYNQRGEKILEHSDNSDISAILKDGEINTSSQETNKQNTVEHSADGGNEMANVVNVFDKASSITGDEEKSPSISHSDQVKFMEDAKKYGHFRDFALTHAQDYGIESIDTFFPEAKAVNAEPDLYKRDTAWVASILSGVTPTPFSRVKTQYVDLTDDVARAKGYNLDRDGNKRRKDEMFKAAKRVTTPTTAYSKQKLDRDDMLDITDFDAVNYMMKILRIMLDEEVARAILIGDGRPVTSDDHINTENIRPIVSDDPFYTLVSVGAADESDSDLVDRFVKAKVGYLGSGMMTAYMSPTTHSELMVRRDQIGHRMYANDTELAAELGVSAIEEVPILEGFKQENGNLVKAILVNPRDYRTGTDKGGEVSNFNDFDIDYAQYKYMMDTRLSGALSLPHSAIVIEQLPKA